MTWKELTKLLVSAGYVLERHGKKHDLYRHPVTGKREQVERHGSTEVRPGLQSAIMKRAGLK